MGTVVFALFLALELTSVTQRPTQCPHICTLQINSMLASIKPITLDFDQSNALVLPYWVSHLCF